MPPFAAVLPATPGLDWLSLPTQLAQFAEACLHGAVYGTQALSCSASKQSKDAICRSCRCASMLPLQMTATQCMHDVGSHLLAGQKQLQGNGMPCLHGQGQSTGRICLSQCCLRQVHCARSVSTLAVAYCVTDLHCCSSEIIYTTEEMKLLGPFITWSFHNQAKHAARIHLSVATNTWGSSSTAADAPVSCALDDFLCHRTALQLMKALAVESRLTELLFDCHNVSTGQPDEEVVNSLEAASLLAALGSLDWALRGGGGNRTSPGSGVAASVSWLPG